MRICWRRRPAEWSASRERAPTVSFPWCQGSATSVNSYAKNSTCSGTTGAYRIDQADDLAFIASFGVTA
jgi:hypothetical protein